ncbi:MAG: hypothetical protein N0E42_19515 [Candidatus Thiodiazotropha endolucinida]|nr:hypothetical protein [Candidatus Thiodiazotropha taylori]MCW4226647.1 hypothetical protein [Candidatus Thiodiazotropha endolucinida]MCG7888209.1 hypothetical protein [Candidatus Thiodiazotropha taylori]MCG7888913.1 hypothetical protein [Candidatus Thiodiazotropha taylori]MCG8104785.1 hypothetical protein [Candidatus Thiodiazotropha taylori]
MTDEYDHKDETNNKEDLENNSKVCLCLYCDNVFPLSEIENWITEKSGTLTPECPKCGVDALLEDRGFALSEDIARAIKETTEETARATLNIIKIANIKIIPVEPVFSDAVCIANYGLRDAYLLELLTTSDFDNYKKSLTSIKGARILLIPPKKFSKQAKRAYLIGFKYDSEEEAIAQAKEKYGLTESDWEPPDTWIYSRKIQPNEPLLASLCTSPHKYTRTKT